MQEGDLKRNGHVDYEELSSVMRSGVSGSVDSLGTWRRCSRLFLLFLYWGGSPGRRGGGGVRLRPYRACHLRASWRLGAGDLGGGYEVAWVRDVGVTVRGVRAVGGGVQQRRASAAALPVPPAICERFQAR